jgi:hypothetical protein
MNTQPNIKLITCAVCGGNKKLKARGMCHNCYNRQSLSNQKYEKSDKARQRQLRYRQKKGLERVVKLDQCNTNPNFCAEFWAAQNITNSQSYEEIPVQNYYECANLSFGSKFEQTRMQQYTENSLSYRKFEDAPVQNLNISLCFGQKYEDIPIANLSFLYKQQVDVAAEINWQDEAVQNEVARGISLLNSM